MAQTVEQTVEQSCTALAANTDAFQHDYRAPGALGVIKVKWVQKDQPDSTWRNGMGSVPMDHCYILSERTHATKGPGATYNPDTGAIANLYPNHYPAIQTLRVPHCYDTKLSALNFFVGGLSDHTGSTELAGFQNANLIAENGMVGLECRALAFSTVYPIPPPSLPPRPQLWWSGTMLMGHRTWDLLTTHFGGVNTQFGVGASVGGFHGISLINDAVGHPFTATATRAGAGGHWNLFESFKNICGAPSPKIPLIGTDLSDPNECKPETLAGFIKLADPDYYEQYIFPILNSPTPADAMPLINGYNVDTLNRPDYVKEAIKKLTARGDLQVKTIIVQGTADPFYYPHNAILAWREIEKYTGKVEMARLYFLNKLKHTIGYPDDVSARNHLQFIKALVHWIEDGTEPGELTIEKLGMTFQANHCTGKGFLNPCECWDAVVDSQDLALRCYDASAPPDPNPPPNAQNKY